MDTLVVLGMKMTKEGEITLRIRIYCKGGREQPLKVMFKMEENSEVLRHPY